MTPSRRNWKQTYENVLAKKLATPEGMALVKAKIAEIENAAAAPARSGSGRTAPAPAAPSKS